MIPPAYPAPSPHGYIPSILDSYFSSLIILTGEDVLDSIPEIILSPEENPLILFSKWIKASFKDSFIYGWWK